MTRSIALVDPICINQDELGEKSRQVQMMGTIYSKAARTWLWLALRGENSDLAMKLVHNISPAHFLPEKLKEDESSWRALSRLMRRP